MRKSNILDFRMAMQNFRIACEIKKEQRQFRTLCEMSHTLQNHPTKIELTMNFAHHAKSHMVC